MSGDGFKGLIHFGAGCLVATMGLYNLGEALSERRKARHVVNATIYLLAVPWECWNTYGHWGPDA